MKSTPIAIALVPFMENLNRVLPKGEGVPVPLNCSVHVGPPITWAGDKAAFMETLRAALERLHAEAPPLHWAEDA